MERWRKRKRPDPSAPELVVGTPIDIEVAVDHGQFLAMDSLSEIDTRAYERVPVGGLVASWGDGIAVLCDSHFTAATNVRVALGTGRPSLALNQFDHVGIASLELPSGVLIVHAPEETNISERPLRLAPGRFGVLVTGSAFGTTDEYGDNGQDRYEVHLWPVTDLIEA